MDLETLYPLVTEAIRRAEVFDEIGAPGVLHAYLDVSLLEESIAKLLPQSDVEGAIARRGAVRAAISAREYRRAADLVSRFTAEGGMDDVARAALTSLGEEALSFVAQEERTMTARYPRASAQYGIAEVRRVAREYYEQGSPLPIY